MNIRILNRFLFVGILASLVLISCSQDSPEVETPKVEDPKIVPGVVTSFKDPLFDPYTDNPVKDEAIDAIVDGYVDGLSFFSDFMDGDPEAPFPTCTNSHDDRVLNVYNEWRTLQSLSPASTLPVTFESDIDEYDGYGAAVKDYVKSVVSTINGDQPLEDSYDDYREATDDLDFTGLTSAQIDTISTILYNLDILVNWFISEPAFEQYLTRVGGSNDVEYRFCSCCGRAYRAISWQCIVSIGAGAVLGAGPSGWIAGAIAGGMAGSAVGPCPWN